MAHQPQNDTDRGCVGESVYTTMGSVHALKHVCVCAATMWSLTDMAAPVHFYHFLRHYVLKKNIYSLSSFFKILLPISVTLESLSVC